MISSFHGLTIARDPERRDLQHMTPKADYIVCLAIHPAGVRMMQRAITAGCIAT